MIILSQIKVLFTLLLLRVIKKFKKPSDVGLKEIIEKYEAIGYRFNIHLAKDFAFSEKLDNRRIILIFICKLSCFITSIRFGMIAISNKKIISLFTANILYESENQNMFGFLLSMAANLILMISSLLNWMEFKKEKGIFGFANNMKLSLIDIHLSSERLKRLEHISYVLIQYIARQTYWSLKILLLLSNLYLTFNYYNHINTIYSIFGIILWTVPTYFAFQQLSGSVAIGFVEWSFSALYFRYAFNTIQLRIKLFSKLMNPKLVIRAIEEHNNIVKLCNQFNDLVKYVVFLLYYLGTPGLMLTLYVITTKKTEPVIFIAATAIVGISFTAVLLINWSSSKISKEAQRPRNYFFRYLTRKTLNFRMKRKILSFIEHLCEREFGFWCLDLFPLNVFEFYMYCTYCASLFILSNNVF